MQAPLDPYPLYLLGIGILTIFVLVLKLRVNAFLALLAAALVIGLLSPRVMLEPISDGVDVEKASQQLAILQVPKTIAFEFGRLMGLIGIPIALATIIGKALMESGGADRIVRAFTRLFGENLASVALLVSGFVLAIPVFFDTVFLLLVPLAKALRLRTGKNYLFYLIAIGAGGAITHSLVPPTPGPLTMAAILHVDLGVTILVGLAVGIPLAVVGYAWAYISNRMGDVPLRQTGTVSLEELEERALRPDHELPNLFVSFLPIILPVLLIAVATIVKTAGYDEEPLFVANDVVVTCGSLTQFFGDKNIALLLATLCALLLVAKQTKMTRNQLGTFTAGALDEAGMILLITCAGGAFGAMLNKVGVGDSIRSLQGYFGLHTLVVAWLLAALFKIAQGSGTVSMITTANIMLGIIAADLSLAPNDVTYKGLVAELGYHPVYLVMAIGCGSKIASWMNDSGFWVVCKMGGLSEVETFRSWTLCLAFMGLAGLPLVLLLAHFLPLV